jgi:phosphoserine phosphatase
MKTKLLFLDMEGTLVSAQNIKGRSNSAGTSLWSRLFHELGPEALAIDNLSVERWERGEYSGFVAWIEESVRLLKEFGLRRSLYLDCVENSPLNPGVAESLALVHKAGIRTAIVSGGFYDQARRIQVELGIHHAYAAVELYWNPDETIRHANIWPSDYAAKADYVELLRRECNVTREECAFVGDGKNDVAIAAHVGLSFAYQAHPELRSAATHVVEDFLEIPRLLGL